MGGRNGRVRGVEGYLAHQKQRPPWDLTVGLCLGSKGGWSLGGGGFLMSEVPLQEGGIDG